MAIRIWSEEAGTFVEPEDILACGADGVYYSVPQINAPAADGVWGQVWPKAIILPLASDAWTPLYIRTDPVGKVAPTIAYLSEGIRFTGRTDDKYSTSNLSWAGIFTKKPYNLGHYSKICARIRVYDNISDKYNNVTYTQLGVATQNTEWGYYSIPTGSEAHGQDTNRVTADPIELTLEIDISGVTGMGYPYIGHSAAYSKVLVKDIWLEA